LSIIGEPTEPTDHDNALFKEADDNMPTTTTLRFEQVAGEDWEFPRNHDYHPYIIDQHFHTASTTAKTGM
jgi:hypothetical protein